MEKSLITQSVAKILDRDLNKVIQELESYQQEGNLWHLAGMINNTGGNLALHISGAINHFIGAVLGKNGYVRKRDEEFSQKNTSRVEVVRQVKLAIHTLHQVLPGVSNAELEKEFPETLGGVTMTTGHFLIHLVSHISYHLGQINYHRRLLDQK
jgi:uncharacterized damage-inducible protein DinB